MLSLSHICITARYFDPITQYSRQAIVNLRRCTDIHVTLPGGTLHMLRTILRIGFINKNFECHDRFRLFLTLKFFKAR